MSSIVEAMRLFAPNGRCSTSRLSSTESGLKPHICIHKPLEYKNKIIINFFTFVYIRHSFNFINYI